VAIAKPPRRRRTPEEAREEILAAARELLADQPSHEVTVSAIMAATTLARKSFYVYFRDRGQLLADLVEPMRERADASLERWRESDEIVAAGRAALLDAAHLYQEHGAILRALATASEHDAEAARVWRAVHQRVIDVAAAKIAEAAPGDLDARATAEALVGMNVAVFLDRLPGADDDEVARVVEVLGRVWERTLYLRG
jgi:AcrR family transcriptional regulator